MKIAIFHNFMDNIGGAEVVSLTLARHLGADIYTTNINPEKITKMGFEDILPHIKSIGTLPTNAPFRQQLALWKFRNLNLGKTYDFYIISGDWAMSGAVNNHPNLWYAHSPLNELWQFKNYIKAELMSWWKRPVFELWVQMNRILTTRYSKGVDNWVCNSKNTQDRIRRFYGKEAQVAYPPIDTAKYSHGEDKGYWLAVNRLFKNKRVELQMEAFAEMPSEKLIVVGSYESGSALFEQYRKDIEKIKPANAEIRHWVSNDELINLYAGCKGFITTARDEDFGMTVVEALASGKPVIACNEGGYKESMDNGKTGILIDDISPEKIRLAVNEVNNILKDNPHAFKAACIEKSKKFDVHIFISKIREILAPLS